MLFFFDVSGPDNVRRDIRGAEAKDLEEARLQAVEAIGELWREFPDMMQMWTQHSLEILDVFGTKLAVLDIILASAASSDITLVA
jgi:hypothetical protein